MTKEEIEKILRSHDDREGFYVEECAEELFKHINPTTPLPDDEMFLNIYSEYSGERLTSIKNIQHRRFTGEELFKFCNHYATSLLKAQEQGHEWVSVDKSLPRHEQDVLWCMDAAVILYGHLSESEGRVWVYVEDESWSISDFTHWKRVTHPQLNPPTN